MVNKCKKSFSIEDRSHVRLGRVGQALPNHENIACKTPVQYNTEKASPIPHYS